MQLKKILFMKVPLTINIIVLLTIFIFIWGWFSASLILRVPKLALDINPANFNLNFENVKFKTVDGVDIDGWFVYADKKSNKTIVACHGWGANRADIFPSTMFLLKEGYNLLYFDFRNHGKSGGHVSSLGRLESYDLRAAVDFLKKERPLQSEKIGVYGISMGASVSVIAASEDKRIEAVVADSPFSGFNYIVARYAKLFYKIPKYPLLPVTFLFTRLRLGFNPETASAAYSVSKISPRPVFFIHGESDVRIPITEGRKLYELAGSPKEFWSVPGADHMEASSMNSIEYRKRVGGFFNKFLYGNFKSATLAVKARHGQADEHR